MPRQWRRCCIDRKLCGEHREHGDEEQRRLPHEQDFECLRADGAYVSTRSSQALSLRRAASIASVVSDRRFCWT